ncbi:MAG: ATP-dependent RNA helicase DbpA [Verrucomicrobia bacterium]|nr:ATP-dependent RNA helicase DbpA [Verrucomicrobiota bacterium]MCH8512581.1 ATP-dependent RNA helicase DbpA [Kiritimatiellia bacterium]
MTTPTAFDSLSLSPALLENLSGLGYTEPTPIQAAALPLILEGRDVLGQAKTGSGKTAAFGLGLLNQIDPTRLETQALVICPVRELAEQVATEIRRLARNIPNIKLVTLCGGMPGRPQEISMRAGAHIVVGTPGRIAKHIRKDLLQVTSITTLVLDEADRLLDMGFAEEVMEVVKPIPRTRQTLLFSATFPEEIRSLSRKIQKNPESVIVDTALAPGIVEEREVFAKPQDKTRALSRILRQEMAESALVFCATRQGCREVAKTLASEGFSVATLHGEMEQRDRSDTLIRLANRSVCVLVATDVAARGLDIDDLPLVIHYDPANDPDIHLHRTGRTGRAGRSGKAFSLVERPVPGSISWGDLSPQPGPPPAPPMVSFLLNGGKKDKIRPGDLVGVMVNEAGLNPEDLGHIHISDTYAVIAFRNGVQRKVEKWAAKGRIKGKRLSPMYVPDIS